MLVIRSTKCSNPFHGYVSFNKSSWIRTICGSDAIKTVHGSDAIKTVHGSDNIKTVHWSVYF